MPSQTNKDPVIIGIVNITADSFSDGGLFLEPEKAIAHAKNLIDNGAAVIEIGAVSSHPDSKLPSIETEISRLENVLAQLNSENVTVAVDSFRLEVQRFAIKNGAAYINDIQGFPNPEIYSELCNFPGFLILMHSIQKQGPATRQKSNAKTIMTNIYNFFEKRLNELMRAGIDRSRIIIDPGMGFFLSTDPEASLIVLRSIPEIKKYFGLPLLISVSRKSFLGAITGKAIPERGPATLTAELFAAARGIDYIRTHDVSAIVDGLKVMAALQPLERLR